MWLREKEGGCEQCRRDHEFMGAGPPPCAACDPPQLLPGNLAAWEVIEVCDLGLGDGMGGINLGNLRQVADALGLAWDETMIRKLTILARWRMGENLKDLLGVDSEQ